jgi:hypothetical protein
MLFIVRTIRKTQIHRVGRMEWFVMLKQVVLIVTSRFKGLTATFCDPSIFVVVFHVFTTYGTHCICRFPFCALTPSSCVRRKVSACYLLLAESDLTLHKYDTSQTLLLGMTVINSWYMFRSCTGAISVVIISIRRSLLFRLRDTYKRQPPWRFMSFMSKDRGTR